MALLCGLWMMLLVSVSTTTATPELPSCSLTDRDALLALKSAVSGFSKFDGIQTDSWSLSTSCCSWAGITCSGGNGHSPVRVTGLFLSNVIVQQPYQLAAAISKLSELEALSLEYLFTSRTHPSLQLPVEFRSLHKLTTLSLLNNNFSGSIPPQWDEITSLKVLNISMSPYIAGHIPSSFCKLRNLQSLSVTNSPTQPGALSGIIPTCFGTLSQLIEMNLANNQITGHIPSEIGQLKKLENLDLSNNLLTGTIPSSTGSLTQLQILRLEGNKFSGRIPASMGNLAKLQELRLGSRLSLNKELSGCLPLGIGGRSSLRILHIHGTSIGGPLPARLGLENVEEMVLENNEFSGTIPAVFGTAQKLVVLNLAGNHLHGEIPKSLSRLSLTILNLANNELSGCIPADLGNAVQSGWIDLRNNKLTGGFPPSLWQGSKIFLSNNQLTSLPPGNFPPKMNFVIEELLLDSNNFTGTVPPWIFNVLFFINLGNNKFESPLPTVVTSLSVSYLNLSRNLFTGYIPEKLANMGGLNTLDLSFNQFSGRIPQTFTSAFGFLNNLVLSHNQLSGPLPYELFRSAFFQSLDLSHNKLSGQIPDMFPNTTSFLTSIDLSFNRLSGRVPIRLFTFSFYLRKVKLSHNKLVGHIPDLGEACRSNNINFVALNDNNFIGDLHGASWITDCAGKINVFDISGNGITGPIPDLRSWTELKVLNLARNQFTGAIPAFLLGDVPYLHVLDLSGNKLSSVESWNSLRNWKVMTNSTDDSTVAMEKRHAYYKDDVLFGEVGFVTPFSLTISTTKAIDLSGNEISGELAPELGLFLTGLRVLDVSRNHLYGALPGADHGSFRSLRVLNVSYNSFSGRIPESINRFSASVFEGNHGLCGLPLPSPCGLRH